MSELISGKEALIALANGEQVQCTSTGENEWTKDIYSIQPYYFLGGGVGQFQFRIKPRTITINGIEVAAPFKPKDCEEAWHIWPSNKHGYGFCYSDASDNSHFQFGAWRTEEEIKQVVAALRSIFKESY